MDVVTMMVAVVATRLSRITMVLPEPGALATASLPPNAFHQGPGNEQADAPPPVVRLIGTLSSVYPRASALGIPNSPHARDHIVIRINAPANSRLYYMELKEFPCRWRGVTAT